MQTRIVVTVLISFIPFVIWTIFQDIGKIEDFYLFSKKSYAMEPHIIIQEAGHYWPLICLLNLCAYTYKCYLKEKSLPYSKDIVYRFLLLSFFIAIAHLFGYIGWRYRIPNEYHLGMYFIYGDLLYLKLKHSELIKIWRIKLSKVFRIKKWRI